MKTIFCAALAAPFLLASLPVQADVDYRAKAIETLHRDFKPKGQAKLDRLNEDAVQAICNRTGNNPPNHIAEKLMADQMATIQFPADGKLMGNWKKGEKLAQNGKGFGWRDKPGPIGGACYNCHQIGPKELSFGTVGPSLAQFGKLRGNGPDMQKYVYAKIYNSKSHFLCSDMPRFGYVGALTESNIKDLVALLLDPNSPVNK